MALVEDQDLIQAFCAHCSYPALGIGIRIWRSIGRVDNLDLFGNKDGVERLRELAVVVMDEKPNRPLPRLQLLYHLASLLGYPCPSRMGCAAGEMDSSAPHFDEEEHVYRLQE
jgi:hypothetical protein